MADGYPKALAVPADVVAREPVLPCLAFAKNVGEPRYMKSQICVLIGLAASALGGGCVAVSTTDKPASAPYVGDRARVLFDEVVVSLPLRESNTAYQNLHVTPAALVNVRKTTSAPTYQSEEILRRVETRVAARLTEVLSGLPQQSLKETTGLRQRILAEAQAVVDDAVRQWKHGADYRVEMVIASMYWTDASAGRSPPARRGWWW